MKKVSVSNLQESDIVAKDVCTSQGAILVPKGTKIKKEYISHLQELDILYIYIEGTPELTTTEEKIQMHHQEFIRVMIEKYSYCGSNDLTEISEKAEEIMEDILNNPEVLYNISCVRDKSISTYSHCINVAALSILIGLQLKMEKKRVHDIGVGALLHDLGLIYLPYDCGDLIFEELDEGKKKEIMKHVITGYSMLESQAWLSGVSKDIVLHHHERMDGSGYPMHLKNDRIKLETRIVSLCDEFDSSVYGNLKQKKKIYQVMDYITSQAGIKFDYEVVQAFLRSVAIYPTGTQVITNEGDRAIVIRQNASLPDRPVLRMVCTKEGVPYQSPVEKDLTKELTVCIIDTIDAG